MPLKVINLRDRIKKRWDNHQGRHENAYIEKYFSSSKMSILCKCPRCEIEHRLLIHWCGRGTPRVFCPACRALIAGIGDASIDQFGGCAIKNSQKPAYCGFEFE